MVSPLAVSIAGGLNLKPERIMEVARTASTRYRRYPIRKAGSTRLRWIHHPEPELKAIQRILNEHILSDLPVHDAAYAYRQGRSIGTHALVHAERKFLLRLDLKDFFPTITFGDVDRFLRDSHARGALSAGPGWGLNDIDIQLLCQLCCRHERLSIGAPSSPVLSNAICHELDVQLTALHSHMVVRYTRYSDDLYFSSDAKDLLGYVPGKVQDVLDRIRWPGKQRINAKKTHHMSRGRRRTVTGVVITPDGKLSVGRELKRRVRARIHQHAKLTPSERRSLAGMLAFIQGLEPDFIARLYRRYGVAVIDEVRRHG